MCPDYRCDALMVNYGTVAAALRPHENKTRKVISKMDEQDVNRMITPIDEKTVSCRSFTYLHIAYQVFVEKKKKKKKTTVECSCPYNKGICRHMFLVARALNISFWPTVMSTSPATSTPSIIATTTTTTTTDTTAVPTTDDETVSQKFKDSLLLDNREQWDKLERLAFAEVRQARNSSSNADIEYGMVQLRRLITEMQRINNPNAGPSKQ
ncbi:hypothetical protein BC941DRAFT_518224, partial [Chlamydoabsidia padenii]